MAKYLFALRGKLESDLPLEEIIDNIRICVLANHRGDLHNFLKAEFDFVQVEQADYPKVNLEEIDV